MQILGEVPEGSGDDAEVRFRKIRSGSGWLRCKYAGQDPVPESCGADT